MRWIEKSIGSIARQADVSEEDLAIVNYGFVQGLKSVTGILLSVLLGILMRIPLSCILFLGFYIALRIYAGGYHAESEKQCAVLSAVSIAAAYAWIKWGSGTAAAMDTADVRRFFSFCRPLTTRDIVWKQKKNGIIEGYLISYRQARQRPEPFHSAWDGIRPQEVYWRLWR